MLQTIESPSHHQIINGIENTHLRQYVYVSDLMKVTGLGKYQACKYFLEIKKEAGLNNFVRYIHIDKFMEYLINYPSLQHITRNDMRNAMMSLI